MLVNVAFIAARDNGNTDNWSAGRSAGAAAPNDKQLRRVKLPHRCNISQQRNVNNARRDSRTKSLPLGRVTCNNYLLATATAIDSNPCPTANRSGISSSRN